jgi:hypothetical protein
VPTTLNKRRVHWHCGEPKAAAVDRKAAGTVALKAEIEAYTPPTITSPKSKLKSSKRGQRIGSGVNSRR